MVLKISERRTTFSIEVSSDSEIILNEKSKNSLGLNLREFTIVSTWNFELG
jgi:hypothetical protein